MLSIAETIGWVVTAVALVGVFLNNARRRECFLIWMLSNVASAGLHLTAGMWALTARDMAFLVLAVHGWCAWGRVQKQKGTDSIPARVNANAKEAGQ